MMHRILCWLVGHDRMTTIPAHGTCLRCGQREKPRRPAREAVSRTSPRSARL